MKPGVCLTSRQEAAAAAVQTTRQNEQDDVSSLQTRFKPNRKASAGKHSDSILLEVSKN